MKRFLFCLLLLSLGLRLIWINKIPNELFGDEIDVGYQAYSLLHTGRDLYSRSIPLYPKSLSEFRLPVLLYATVLPEALLGLNSVSVRLPEALFGSLAPLILFILVLRISKKRSLAVFSAIFLCLAPWHIHYSRAAFEVVIMLDFIMLGSIYYLKKKSLLSALFLCLSFYTYSTAIVFVPLLVLGFCLYLKQFPSVKYIIFSILLLVPFLGNVFSGAAGSRYQLLSIFDNPAVIKESIDLRNSSASSNEFIFHNRYLATGEFFLKNYLRAFSTDFLFDRGDPTIRHSFIISGELLPIIAPFILIGLAVLIYEKQFFWLYWLAISPIPSALTIDGGYHATRLFVLLVPLCVATAYGYWHLLKNAKIYWHILVFFFILSNFIYLAHFYVIHYPKISWRWWHVGYAQALTELKQLSPDYTKIYINNTYEPALIRFLFYTQYDPHLFQNQFTLDQPHPNVAPDYNGFLLGEKYIFGTFSDNINKFNLGSFLQPNALYMISARDEIPAGVDWTYDKPAGVKILSEINSPENTHIFYLITKSP